MLTRHLFNLDFLAADNFDYIVTDLTENPTPKDKLPVVITPNVDLTVHLNKNKRLLHALQHSRYILPDGFPIILFSKLLGRPLKKRLAGSDLFPEIWEAVKNKKQRAFFIAPHEKVKTILEKEYADAQFYIPPFFTETEENAEQQAQLILPLLLQHQPQHIFLGLRYPKQEMLILNLYEKIEVYNNSKPQQEQIIMPIFYNLGASYEFYCGLKKRAPKVWQQYHLEWFYRFLSEPKRTFKRYFWDDLYILILFFKELSNKNPVKN